MKSIKILYLGDLVGLPGMRGIYAGLKGLMKDLGAHASAVNGENLAEGFGLNPQDVEKLLALGVSVISSGNHIWQKDDLLPILDSEPRLLRPHNYPPGAPGHGSVFVDIAGHQVAFVNLQGRERMGAAVDCPFRSGKKLVEELRRKTKSIIIDFHAEDVREKEALAHALDGRVSAVLGTHTHVQTADERILPGGTGYITDLGMCGPDHSVIGTKPELSVRRSLTQLPLRMEVSENTAVLRGVILELDIETGLCHGIRRVAGPSEGE